MNKYLVWKLAMLMFVFESILSLRILNIAFNFVLFTSVSLNIFVRLKLQRIFCNKFQISLIKSSIITTQTPNISRQLDFSFYLHKIKRLINCAYISLNLKFQKINYTKYVFKTIIKHKKIFYFIFRVKSKKIT